MSTTKSAPSGRRSVDVELIVEVDDEDSVVVVGSLLLIGITFGLDDEDDDERRKKNENRMIRRTEMIRTCFIDEYFLLLGKHF